MNILKRISSIFSASVHNQLDKMEDPILMAKQTIRELDKDLEDARASLFVMMGNQKLLSDKVKQATEKLNTRKEQEQKLLALESEDELIAKVKEDIATLTQELTEYEMQSQEMKESIHLVEENIAYSTKLRDKLSQRLDRLVSEQNTAKAMDRAVDVSLKLDHQNTQSDFVRYENKVSTQMAQAKAKMEYLQKKEDTLDHQINRAIAKGK